MFPPLFKQHVNRNKNCVKLLWTNQLNVDAIGGRYFLITNILNCILNILWAFYFYKFLKCTFHLLVNSHKNVCSIISVYLISENSEWLQKARQRNFFLKVVCKISLFPIQNFVYTLLNYIHCPTSCNFTLFLWKYLSTKALNICNHVGIHTI